MKTKLIVFLCSCVLVLSACGASRPALSPEMVTAMNAYADQTDLQYAGSVDAGIVRLCASEPTALYWHEDAKIYAVTCLIQTSFAMESNLYGAVLVDGTTYAVLHAEHLNADSQRDLEHLIASVGWVRK